MSPVRVRVSPSASTPAASWSPAPAAALEHLAATGVPVDVLGTVGGDGLEVTCGAEHARRPRPDLRAVLGRAGAAVPLVVWLGSSRTYHAASDVGWVVSAWPRAC